MDKPPAISIASALQQTIAILKKDTIIIAPYLIFVLVVFIIETQLGSLFSRDISKLGFIARFLFTNWILESVAISLTISCAAAMYRSEAISFREVVKTVRKYYIQLLVGTGFYAVPMTWVAYHLMTAIQLKQPIDMWRIGLILIMIPYWLCFTFVPAYIVLGHRNGFSAVSHSYRLVVNRIKDVMIYIVLVMGVYAVLFSLSVLFLGIPVLGPVMMVMCLHGIGNTCVYIINVIFFYRCSTPRVSINL